MTEPGSILSSGPVWGAAGVFLTALFAWLTQRSKGQVDESVAVRQQWEKLTGGLQDRLATVEKEFADYRIEMARKISDLEQRHAGEMAEQRRNFEAKMKALSELNEGLQRQIIQNSQSSAQMIGEAVGAARRRKRRGEGDE